VKITVYLYDEFDETTLKIFQLLDLCGIKPICKIFDSLKTFDDISKEIDIKVRRMPLIKIDNEVCGYFDLVELLINKGVINYKGELCLKK
jgi:hypothetical protein